MVDLPPLANHISNFLLLLLLITFIYALIIRFVSDETLYDRSILSYNDSSRIMYQIEPLLPNGSHPLLPNIFADFEVFLSLVVPAYNEEKRLPQMLDETMRYLKDKQLADPNFTFEVLIVDDGTTMTLENDSQDCDIGCRRKDKFSKRKN